LVPEWEGNAAGEVETGVFNVEDGPGAAAAMEVGGLAALERETEGATTDEWDDAVEAMTARSRGW
jgi:hypothetical protein